MVALENQNFKMLIRSVLSIAQNVITFLKSSNLILQQD